MGASVDKKTMGREPYFYREQIVGNRRMKCSSIRLCIHFVITVLCKLWQHCNCVEVVLSQISMTASEGVNLGSIPFLYIFVFPLFSNGNDLFLQNNSRPHRALVTRNWFNEVLVDFQLTPLACPLARFEFYCTFMKQYGELDTIPCKSLATNINAL